MADDLREVILGVEAVVGHVFDLLRGVGIRVCPSAQRQPRLARANLRAQLPRVLHAPRAADPLVTAEHHQRRKSVLPRLLGIREAELYRDAWTSGTGSTCSRVTSRPRFVTRWRRLFSSCVPTALSVRKTRTSRQARLRTAWYMSIHASIPSREPSSARGGRSSAAITVPPEFSAAARDIEKYCIGSGRESAVSPRARRRCGGHAGLRGRIHSCRCATRSLSGISTWPRSPAETSTMTSAMR
mgnify:CR=1 FL=1